MSGWKVVTIHRLYFLIHKKLKLKTYKPETGDFLSGKFLQLCVNEQSWRQFVTNEQSWRQFITNEQSWRQHITAENCAINCVKLRKASDTRTRNLSNILRKSTCPISCASSHAINLPKFFVNCAQHVLLVTCAIKWRHSILNAFITAELYCATSIKFAKRTYNCKFNNFSPCLYSYVCRNQAYMSITVTYVIQPALKYTP